MTAAVIHFPGIAPTKLDDAYEDAQLRACHTQADAARVLRNYVRGRASLDQLIDAGRTHDAAERHVEAIESDLAVRNGQPPRRK